VVDVAIIIVTYKSAGLAINCLASLDAERSTPGVHFHVFIVDNASGDTPEVAEAIEANNWSAWVTLITAPANGGFACGNNLALQRAYDYGPPDYVHLINPDTIVRPGAIGALVDFLAATPTAGIAGSSFENADGSDWPIAFRFPSLLSEVESGLQFGPATRLLRRWTVPMRMGSTPAQVDWVPGASMMIRRAVLDTIGGFDEGYFLYFEETDFCLRAKRAGFPTWYVPASRVMHIAGQSTKITERNAAPRRLPPYWFESRRRYFVLAYGAAYAVAADLAALAASALGLIKSTVQGRGNHRVPFYLSDLLKHSVAWPSNRSAMPPRRLGFPPRPGSRTVCATHRTQANQST
jgi:GT2 family glycosyltransferase